MQIGNKPGGSSSGGGGLFSAILSATPTQSSTGLVNWLNQASASAVDAAVGLSMVVPITGEQIRGLYTNSVPATPYRLRACLIITTEGTVGATHGLGWRNSTNGRLEFLMMSHGANNGGQFVVQQESDIGVYVANLQYSFYSAYAKGVPYWFELEDDGTNVYYRYSFDGVNFTALWIYPKAGSYLGATGYNQLFWLTSMGASIGGNGGASFAASPVAATILSWAITSP